MNATTFTEAQINERHRERVATLIDLYGSTLAIPREVMARLHSRHREDWQQHVEERDGKRKAQDWRIPVTPPSDEEMAAVAAAESTDVESTYGSDEPDAQALADADDAQEILAEAVEA